MADACTEGVDTGFVALGYFKVAMLGVVQGITELMPISSTAHMRLVPADARLARSGLGLLGGDADGGPSRGDRYFWADLRWLATRLILGGAARRASATSQFQFVLWVVIATIPIGIAGLALSKVLNRCGSPLRDAQRHRLGLSCHGAAVGLPPRSGRAIAAPSKTRR